MVGLVMLIKWGLLRRRWATKALTTVWARPTTTTTSSSSSSSSSSSTAATVLRHGRRWDRLGLRIGGAYRDPATTSTLHSRGVSFHSPATVASIATPALMVVRLLLLLERGRVGPTPTTSTITSTLSPTLIVVGRLRGRVVYGRGATTTAAAAAS